MIAQLYSDAKVFEVLVNSLEEEGIAVKIGQTLLVNDVIDENKAILMKPDSFYSSKKMKALTPKSADGVVFVDNSGEYHLYVVELKSSQLPLIKKKEITEKFDTIFGRFFILDYAHVFHCEQSPYNLVALNIWLVCDPLQLRKNAKDEEDFMNKAAASKAKMKTLLADYSIGFKSYRFKGVVATIQPMLSPPIIEEHGFVDLLA